MPSSRTTARGVPTTWSSAWSSARGCGARRSSTSGPTPYVNTIHRDDEPPLPGDPAMERRVRSLIRWNAIATILRANKESSELGGHIASYQSAAMLYEIGFNHFWHAPSDGARRRPRLHPGPLLARDLRPRLPRGPDHGGAARGLPPGGLAPRRPGLLPPPVADAGLLAVPDGLDGARADHGDLPGAVHALPRRPRHRRHRRTQGLGFPRRRRVRRARVARRDRARRARAARQPRLRRQLQPAAARRAGAGQRQDHPGAGDDLPRRRAGTCSR